MKLSLPESNSFIDPLEIHLKGLSILPSWWHSHIFPITTSAWCFTASSYKRDNDSSLIQSSLSKKAMYSSVAISKPTLRAADAPPFSWWITLIRSSFLAYSSAISPDKSVEPSLTNIISIRRPPWFFNESIQTVKYFSTLYIGIMIDMSIWLSVSI